MASMAEQKKIKNHCDWLAATSGYTLPKFSKTDVLAKMRFRKRTDGKKKHLNDSRDFWKIFCGLTRWKLNFLEGVCLSTAGIIVPQRFKSHSHESSHSHRGCSMIVWPTCSFRTWTTCLDWWNRESLLFTRKSSRRMFDHRFVIWHWSELRFCSRTMKRTPASQLLNGWKHQNEGFGMVLSKSGLESPWNAVTWSWKAQQFCKEEWGKISLQRKTYCQLKKILDAEAGSTQF